MLHVLVKTGLQYQKADNQKVIMKSPRLVAWRYKYLINVHKYHEDGYLIVYLDETWFVSHDAVRMLRSDSTKSSSLSEPPLRGKRVVKGHLLENTLTANLPKQRKIKIVMENAKYHSRFILHEEG